MSRVVVFGGSGFLGSYVADELNKRGYEVVVADRKKSAHLSGEEKFVLCDIMDPRSIEDVLKSVDFVFNFAGLANLDDCIEQPKLTIEQNVIGNINILEECRKTSLKRFVYASSAYAFSNKGSFYGISKLASEKIVEEYYFRHGLHYTTIRYGSLYGERADENNGVYRMLRDAIERGIIEHRGDGNEVREYIHAVDAAKLSVDVIENDSFINERVLLTGVERMQQKELLRMIREILNEDIEIKFTNQSQEGHYDVTPYSYRPEYVKKLVSNSFIDLGQGVVSCLQTINGEIRDKGNNN